MLGTQEMEIVSMSSPITSYRPIVLSSYLRNE